MTLQEQMQYCDALNVLIKETIQKKGDDYSNEDRLSNFKLAGAIAGVKPEVDCLVLIATKVARLGVLLNNDKAVKNESIQDTALDLVNFAILLHMLLNEGQEKINQNDGN